MGQGFGSAPYLYPMKIRMRFTGQARDKKTGKVKTWGKGDVVEGEFDDLLPDTFRPVNTMAEKAKRPVTRRRRATRKK